MAAANPVSVTIDVINGAVLLQLSDGNATLGVLTAPADVDSICDALQAAKARA